MYVGIPIIKMKKTIRFSQNPNLFLNIKPDVKQFFKNIYFAVNFVRDTK